MSSIGIYMEGGGPTRSSGRAALRQGMEQFLISVKQRAREASWQWKFACWGGRDATFDRFRRAVQDGEHAVAILLIDAEGPVTQPVLQHLKSRDPHWDLRLTKEKMVHLMIQTMETWIVADVDALANYYGQGFRDAALPQRNDLETEPKASVVTALHNATRKTRKGPYHKIHHASDLLKRLAPHTVRKRCRSCDRLFATLEHALP